MMMTIYPAGGTSLIDKIEKLYGKRFPQRAIPIHRRVMHQSRNMMGDHDSGRFTPGAQHIPKKIQPLAMQKRKIPGGKFPTLISNSRKIRDASLKVIFTIRADLTP
jgi:hypothetical protein